MLPRIFAKYNKGTKTYDNLNKVLFIDSETKIGMFRYCLKYVATNAIKQKLKASNQNYSIVAIFEDTKKNKLVFKNVCNIKIKK